MAGNFIVNKEYDSYAEFFDEFQNWCKVNYHPIHIHDSHKNDNEELRKSLVYSRVTICCVHFGKPRDFHHDQSRKNTLTMKRDCGYKVRLGHDRKTDKFVIGKQIN
jgi:hypothetical protein